MDIHDIALIFNNTSEFLQEVVILFAIVLLLLVIFFFFTLTVLIYHRWYKKLCHRNENRFSKWTISYLLDQEIPEPSASLIQLNILRDTILKLSLVIKGHERRTLLHLYKKLNLWETDIDRLRNRYWHKRLAALVRLDQWQFCLGLEKLKPLLLDENYQIQMIALKNLSRTKEIDEALYVLDHISRYKVSHAVLYEVIFRLIRIHRELLLSALQEQKRVIIWPCLLTVIGDSHIIEGIPYLIRFANNSDDSRLRIEALSSLGKIGDPRGIEVSRKAVSSQNSEVKLAAIKSLYHIDATELKSMKAHFFQDSSFEVKSWINHYMKEMN